MEVQVQNNLLNAVLFQNVAQKYLECIVHETNNADKQFINLLITRLKVNRNDLYSRITTQEGRDRFVKEFEMEDALLFGNVFLLLLNMNEQQRTLVETLCEGIAKGEEIIFDSGNNY